MEHDTPTSSNTERLAIGLGLFSVGLGLAEVLAPRAVGRLIGMPEASSTVLRSFGAREVGSGLAILTQPDRATWLWSRVGGDAVDLSYLATGFANENGNATRLALAMAAVAGVAALDVATAQQLQKTGRRPASARAVRVEEVTTINRNVHDVYDFWRSSRTSPASCATSNRSSGPMTGARAGAPRGRPG
jgi:uncharacterized protein YjeT (DUF2065 family)